MMDLYPALVAEITEGLADRGVIDLRQAVYELNVRIDDPELMLEKRRQVPIRLLKNKKSAL